MSTYREIRFLTIPGYITGDGEELRDFDLSLEIAGSESESAPYILVCHALTGNSSVAGPEGWWGDLIGPGRTIDTNFYRVISIDIPGNCHLLPPLSRPDLLSLHDVARLHLIALEKIGVTHLKAIMGPSMGGALAWQIAALAPKLSELLIPIASDYLASEWLLAQTEVQKLLLESSTSPLYAARIHGMLCYRTPESMLERFQGRCGDKGMVGWLRYHGHLLEGRFSEDAYRVMTHLTSDIHVADDVSGLLHIESDIHVVAIDSDMLFPISRAVNTVKELNRYGKSAALHILSSPHGHDAFLMEYEKLSEILAPLFTVKGENHSNHKRIYLAVVGHGNVGGEFLDQVTAQRKELAESKGMELIIFAIAATHTLLLDAKGIDEDWRDRILTAPKVSDPISEIMDFADRNISGPKILIDNTPSQDIPHRYEELVSRGFDLISSNKVANTLPMSDYQSLRSLLARRCRTYRYETNVGAGLPLIENLQRLHMSGDRIHLIRGLFSGSLNFIFNRLSEGEDFCDMLREASARKYTEPDPRVDLSGLDVARKVLILARELGLACELTEVEVQNLVPPTLQNLSTEELQGHISDLGQYISGLMTCNEENVMRYVGDVEITAEGTPRLVCSLQAVPRKSPLGGVSEADSCFEIYTESYGSLPIIIQGAGAGAVVTARGVFGDLLRTAESC